MTDADAPHRGVGVVMVAAGSGTRLGAQVPKAYVTIAGRTLLSYAVERVAQVPGLRSLAVVVPAEGMPGGSLWDPQVGRRGIVGMSFSAGGEQRSDSVRIGLTRIASSCDVVLIHDAARALTPLAVFERVVGAVRAGAAGAVPALPVIDTIKTVDAEGIITGTPDRASLRAVQTPQGFHAEVLRAAYAAGGEATDDAALVEAAGGRVVVVDGDPLAFKITTPADLERAKRLVAAGWSP